MKTIFAIEDDPQIADMLAILLGSQQVTVRHFDDGQRGMDAVREQAPDLLLLDIMMPDINGWQVYDQLRADPQLATLPIIILSVSPQSFERRVRFVNSDVDFYMSKPFDILKLRELVDRLLGIGEWHVNSQQPQPRANTDQRLQPIIEKLSATQPAKPIPDSSLLARRMREVQRRNQTDKLNPDRLDSEDAPT